MQCPESNYAVKENYVYIDSYIDTCFTKYKPFLYVLQSYLKNFTGRKVLNKSFLNN